MPQVGELSPPASTPRQQGEAKPTAGRYYNDRHPSPRPRPRNSIYRNKGKTRANHRGSHNMAQPDAIRGGGNTRVLGVVFAVTILLMIVLFLSFPRLSEEEQKQMKFPRNVADLRELQGLLSRYKEQNVFAVVCGFSAVYIFLVSFSIPGSIFLSVLAGPLFGVYKGLALVSVVATLGAVFCYLLSNYLGRGLAVRCLPTMLTKFRSMIQTHRHNLFFYLLFLRLSPLLPNWFISVASPILDVPLSQFTTATFFGLIPANYIHVNTGLTLSEIDSISSFDPRKILTLLFLGLLALIPTLFRRKFEEMDKRMSEPAEEVVRIGEVPRQPAPAIDPSPSASKHLHY